MEVHGSKRKRDEEEKVDDVFNGPERHTVSWQLIRVCKRQEDVLRVIHCLAHSQSLFALPGWALELMKFI